MILMALSPRFLYKGSKGFAKDEVGEALVGQLHEGKIQHVLFVHAFFSVADCTGM